MKLNIHNPPRLLNKKLFLFIHTTIDCLYTRRHVNNYIEQYAMYPDKKISHSYWREIDNIEERHIDVGGNCVAEGISIVYYE